MYAKGSARALGVAFVLSLVSMQVTGQECEAYPDLALVAPEINSNPGPQYAEWTRSYQGMPTIERTADGQLWAAWTSGGVNEGPANYVVVVTSGDDGQSWSQSVLVIDPLDHVAAFVPILWRDPNEHLWLLWNQGYGAWWDGRGGAWVTHMDVSPARSSTWARPRRIADGWPGSKPIVLQGGEWLVPVFVSHAASQLAEENEYYRLGLTPCVIDRLSHDLGALKGANVFASTDDGLTFSFRGQANRLALAPDVPGSDLIEHTVVERRDGSVWMLVRTFPGIGESISVDRGRSWSPVEDTGIRHPLTRFFVRSLSSGRLLMVRHNPPEVTYPAGCEDCGELNRSHLTAYLSEDDGATWIGGLELDARATVSYPDGAEADDGRIFVIYDRNRYTDSEILMAVISEADILAGRCVRADCRLRVPVSRPSVR